MRPVDDSSTQHGSSATSSGAAVAGVPKVDARGQGGLLDVVTDRDFARSQRIFFCYAEPSEDGRTNGTALARYREVSSWSIKATTTCDTNLPSLAYFGPCYGA